MKRFLSLIGFVICAPVFAQSTLPSCQGSDVSRWTNCVGTHSERSSFFSSEYRGEWKDGKKHGWGEIRWKVFRPSNWLSSWDDGGSYIGAFRDNFIDGEGSFRDVDGQFQSGGFKNWRFEGVKLGGTINDQPFEYDLVSGKLHKVASTATTAPGNEYQLSPPFDALKKKLGPSLWDAKNSNGTSCGENLSQFGLLEEYPLAAAIAITSDGKVECELLFSKVEDSALLTRVGQGAFVKKVDCRAPGNRCYLILARERLREAAILDASRYLSEIQSQRPGMAGTDPLKATTSGAIGRPPDDSRDTAESVTLLGQENNYSQADAAQSFTSTEGSGTLTRKPQDRRVALVIGNASYKTALLDNPINDATDIANELKRRGFKVITRNNANLGSLRQAVRNFSDEFKKSDVGLIYYSGHGVEAKGENYLIPVDADIRKEYELSAQAYPASQLTAMMEEVQSSDDKKRVAILILDACRDNPLTRSWRSSGRGLARMDAPAGTFISFSTAPGSVAADGRGRNSPFTKHLLQAMRKPDVPIELMFKEVRVGVMGETKGEQIPWDSSSLTGDFFFSRSTKQ